VTPELEARIKGVLTKLAILSEAPAGVQPQLSPPQRGESEHERLKKTDQIPRRRVKPARHSESRIPQGFRLNLDSEGPPVKERSLYEWWLWRFIDAAKGETTEFDMWKLVWQAERDFMERHCRVPQRVELRSGALTENDATDGGAAERAAAERVVEFYEGVSAAEVAVLEYTTEAWTKKARRMHGRNPHDGRPAPEFLDWDEERRTREVAELAAKDLGAKAIGKRLGVDKNTIKKYLPADPIAVAA
jgi:DNA-binding CsgD family transcriptional regulator